MSQRPYTESSGRELDKSIGLRGPVDGDLFKSLPHLLSGLLPHVGSLVLALPSDHAVVVVGGRLNILSVRKRETHSLVEELHPNVVVGLHLSQEVVVADHQLHLQPSHLEHSSEAHQSVLVVVFVLVAQTHVFKCP